MEPFYMAPISVAKEKQLKLTTLENAHSALKLELQDTLSAVTLQVAETTFASSRFRNRKFFFHVLFHGFFHDSIFFLSTIFSTIFSTFFSTVFSTAVFTATFWLGLALENCIAYIYMLFFVCFQACGSHRRNAVMRPRKATVPS